MGTGFGGGSNLNTNNSMGMGGNNYGGSNLNTNVAGGFNTFG
jgi:hypothetical protein